MILAKWFFYVSAGTKRSCLHKNSLWKSCMENSRSWTVNLKMLENSEEFRQRNANRTSIAVSFLFLTWLMKILLLLLFVRTVLAEESVSFDLWEANLVNTALTCKAGLDFSSCIYVFLSGVFCFQDIVFLSGDCFACSDLSLPLGMHNFSGFTAALSCLYHLGPLDPKPDLAGSVSLSSTCL